jgi:hypothetical protein
MNSSMSSSLRQIISAPNNAANCFEHENTRNSVWENLTLLKPLQAIRHGAPKKN